MTTVVQRKKNEDPEAPEEDKASRIAANLARLDAATSMVRPNLQWKGYGWRFMRGSGDAAASGSPAASDGSSSALDGPTETWKEWAIDGFRRRSCYVICVVGCFGAAVAIIAVLCFSSFYGYVISRDPCVVSVETANKLAAFPRRSILDPGYKPVFPKIVHQQWKTKDIPEGVYTQWHNKFKELFPEPEYKHMIWTDENAREMIKNDFPFFLETYDKYEFGIQRADSVRYFVLYKYGGLYADLDYEPLTNFWEHLPKDRAAIVESPYLYNEMAQNSLMSSPARDPFWNETFALLIERHNKPVLQATGPMFLDALMKRAKETFALLPCENFQRLPLHLSAEEEVSPFASQLHRELLGRLAPMKFCGDYHKPECQYAKHHNTASYLPETGILNLLWT